MCPKDYRQPLVETGIPAVPLERTSEGHAIAKIAGSKVCDHASATFGLNYRKIIPSTFLGLGKL
jgi:GDP-L-fucose synthase